MDTLRIARRGVRAIFGRDVFYRPQVDAQLLRLGQGYETWSVCPRRLGPESTVYCFGIGQDLSFELAMIERFGMQVHAFEPTPRSLEWVRSQTLPSRLSIHEYGLAAWDGIARFNPPSDPAHVSFSMVRKAADEDSVSAPVHRLSTIAPSLGHSRLDLLKMDIEGAEYDVLPDCIACGLEIDQILVEFHHRWDVIGVNRTKAAVARLGQAGYRIAGISPNGQEFAFLREQGPA